MAEPDSCCFAAVLIRVLGRESDKYVLERRPNLVNLRMFNTNFAQLLFDDGARDRISYEQVHRLAEDGRALHSRHLTHRLQGCRDMIANNIESPRSRRSHRG